MARTTTNALSLVKIKRSIPKVNLVVMDQPVNPVMNGKNRCKFPSSKDCFVRIGIFDQANNEIRCKNLKQQPSSVIKSKRNGTTFSLGLTCITRHAVHETSVLDVPLDMVVLQRPLNTLKSKSHTNNDVGFWFRFFGKPCRFHIKICLKASFHNIQEISEIIDTVELDIINFECPNNSYTRSVEKSLNTTTLYREKQYVYIMQKLQSLYGNCQWQECKCIGDQLLSELAESKCDYKMCILLVQSKATCQLGEFKNAKLLVKKALDVLPAKSENKDLLIGRAYTCLSLSHQYDMAFGNAEECLRIAKTKLVDYVPCEDTGDFYYQEGRLLLSFIFKVPSIHKELFNEAKEKFEKAIRHFQESYQWENSLLMNKIYSTQIYIAILLFLKDKDGIVTADQIISKIKETSVSLDYETKCLLSFAKAIYFEKMSDHDRAQVNGRVAFDLANKYKLYLEKQWIEAFVSKCSKSENK